MPSPLTLDHPAALKPAASPSIVLSPDELHALTGYRRAVDQLAELHRRGFHRARRAATGSVILERAHYEAVCRGHDAAPDSRPRVRPPQVRAAA